MNFPGHASAQVLTFESARFQPGENRVLAHTQLGCSALHRVGAIFPLSRVVLIFVELDRGDLPLMT